MNFVRSEEKRNKPWFSCFHNFYFSPTLLRSLSWCGNMKKRRIEYRTVERIKCSISMATIFCLSVVIYLRDDDDGIFCWGPSNTFPLFFFYRNNTVYEKKKMYLANHSLHKYKLHSVTSVYYPRIYRYFFVLLTIIKLEFCELSSWIRTWFRYRFYFFFFFFYFRNSNNKMVSKLLAKQIIIRAPVSMTTFHIYFINLFFFFSTFWFDYFKHYTLITWNHIKGSILIRWFFFFFFFSVASRLLNEWNVAKIIYIHNL